MGALEHIASCRAVNLQVIIFSIFQSCNCGNCSYRLKLTKLAGKFEAAWSKDSTRCSCGYWQTTDDHNFNIEIGVFIDFIGWYIWYFWGWSSFFFLLLVSHAVCWQFWIPHAPIILGVFMHICAWVWCQFFKFFLSLLFVLFILFKKALLSPNLFVWCRNIAELIWTVCLAGEEQNCSWTCRFCQRTPIIVWSNSSGRYLWSRWFDNGADKSCCWHT